MGLGAGGRGAVEPSVVAGRQLSVGFGRCGQPFPGGCGDRYVDRVAGASAYVRYWPGTYEATFELLGATRSIVELDNDRDRPFAWNAEWVRAFPEQRLAVALRVEGSEELEDEPGLQYGIAATWRIGRQVSLTLEYLHGEFEGDLTTNDDDQAYDHVDRFGGLLSVEF